MNQHRKNLPFHGCATGAKLEADVVDETKFGFTTPLISEYITDDTWYIHEPLAFTSQYVIPGKTFTVPAGFYTDFASVPKMFRNIISKYGKHAKSAVLHDYLYYCGFLGCKELCDLLFNEGMIFEKEKDSMRLIVYNAVKFFGSSAWDGHRKAGHTEDDLKARLVGRTINDVRKKVM
jgi:hypothetical protein